MSKSKFDLYSSAQAIVATHISLNIITITFLYLYHYMEIDYLEPSIFLEINGIAFVQQLSLHLYPSGNLIK